MESQQYSHEDYEEMLQKQHQQYQTDQVVQQPPSEEDYKADGAAVEEEALERMQILANMSDLEKMDE